MNEEAISYEKARRRKLEQLDKEDDMTQKHTPTPWRIIATGQIAGADGTEITVESRPLDGVLPGGRTQSHAREEEDTAYIVKACNNYGSMVEAIEWLMASRRVPDTDAGREAEAKGQAALEAIAKAEEERR